MDPKKSPIRRTKRQAKVLEEFWDCSVCTYRNTDEAFKCLMCDVRKGTSTRKPRLNSQLAAQQSATTSGSATTNGGGGGSSSSLTSPPATTNHHHSHNNSHHHHHYHKPGSNSSSSSSSTAKLHRHGSGGGGGGDGGVSKHKQKKFARLKNVDRSTAQTREVTVNSLTVVITEYKPKPVRNRRESSDQSESNDSRS